jgi:hypothetical protein
MVNLLRCSILLLLAVSVCARRRLISGDAEKVRAGEYDNVVSLTTSGVRFCSGTLISPGVVLSAAHCFMKMKKSVQVVLPGGKTVGVADVKVHHDFKLPPGALAELIEYDKKINSDLTKLLTLPLPSKLKELMKKLFKVVLNGEILQLYHGDLALVYLNQCVTNVRPVQLPFHKQGGKDLTCKHGIQVGYGNINFEGMWRGGIQPGETVPIARKTTVRIHSPEACEQLLPFYVFERIENERLLAFMPPAVKKIVKKILWDLIIKTHQLKRRPVVCSVPTTKKLQLAGRGDSGGPIFVDGVQVGVLSSSGGGFFTGEGYTLYHTRIDRYLHWIKKYAVDECESFESPRRSLKSLPHVFQNEIYKHSDEKVFKSIRFLSEFDQCPSSGTFF